MPAPVNLAFADAGAGAGSALGWAIVGLAQAQPGTRAGGALCSWRTKLPLLPTDPGAPADPPNTFNAWTGTNVVVNANVTTAPDGSSSADRIRADGVNAEHGVALAPRTFLDGEVYTFGAFLKFDAESRMLGPSLDFGPTIIWAVPNLLPDQPGIFLVSDPVSTPVEVIDASCVQVNGDWMEVSLSWKMNGDGTAAPSLRFRTSAGTAEFAGTNVGHFAWGAFLYNGVLIGAEGFDGGWVDVFTYEATGAFAVWNDGTAILKHDEVFDGGWLDSYVTLVAGAPAIFSPPANNAWEGFDIDWSNTPYYTDVTGTLCGFDVAQDPREDFETEWSNTTWVAAVTGSTASFDSPTFSEAVEDFEERLLDVQYTADAATNTMSAAGHGLVLNDSVMVIATGGLPPAPLSKTLIYWVVNPTTNTFQLAATPGGAAIDITDIGTGTAQIVRGDPARYWNGPNLNPTI